MSQDLIQALKDIENLRSQLDTLLVNKGISNREVIYASKILDIELNKYYKLVKMQLDRE